jgi:hypothetical protein
MILQAILGQKSGIPNNTSLISTVMLSRMMEGMAIYAHDLLKEAYTTYMCGHHHPQCSALVI